MVRTWALELKRAGITANAVIPVAATAMTATVPYFAAAVEADAAGEAHAGVLPSRPRLRHVGRRRRPHRLSRLGCRRRRHRSGDRRRRRPHPGVVAPRAGASRRTATAAGPTMRSTSRFAAEFGGGLQTVGESFPPLPETCSGQRPTAVNRPMTRYEPAIDVDALEAIDVHVHIEVDGHGHSSLPPDLVEAAIAVLQRRRAAPRPRQRRGVLPRAPDGRGRLHRRRDHPPRASGRSPVPRSPRAPRATTTC